MLNEQKIRAALFYLSLAVFFLGSPFILSFALGYRFNPNTLKFTKSGIIVIKTQPQDAKVLLDSRPLNEKTPLTISELLPGRYNIKIELPEHYPWSEEVDVEAGKVTYLDKVILFPLRPDIKQINKNRIACITIDEKKGSFYYVNPEDRLIYKSDLDGQHAEAVSGFLQIQPLPAKMVISQDRRRAAYFNARELAVVSLNSPDERIIEERGFIIDYSDSRVIDVFWHSDNYHFIVLTNKNIEVREASLDTKPVSLADLNKRNSIAYYDTGNDVLYFLDSQRASDGNFYDNFYRIALSGRIGPLKELMKLGPQEMYPKEETDGKK